MPEAGSMLTDEQKELQSLARDFALAELRHRHAKPDPQPHGDQNPPMQRQLLHTLATLAPRLTGRKHQRSS